MMEPDDGVAELAALMSRGGWSSLPSETLAPDVELWAVEREVGVVLPRSYREFLHRFGSARLAGQEVFGLPRHGLWGDVVFMNQLLAPALPPGYVMVSRDGEGRVYCLDTSRMGPDGECPVVLLGRGPGGTIVAHTFLDFLRKAVAGELRDGRDGTRRR